MSKLQQAAVLLGVLCLYGTSALADEQAIQLKSASGRDVVETNCGICHSLDYIQMNSPFQDAKTWQAEVSKMINAFGAPLEPEEAKTVVDYLVSNYGAGGVAPASTAPTGPAPSAIEQQPSRQGTATPTENGTPGSGTSAGRGADGGKSEGGAGSETGGGSGSTPQR